jgi:hypothetical protein
MWLIFLIILAIMVAAAFVGLEFNLLAASCS